MDFKFILYILVLSFVIALLIEWFFFSGGSQPDYVSAAEYPKSKKEIGRDFERKVADELELLGWSTSFTPETGDQGVDILADKYSIKVAVQCKCQQNPVGNRAVSEVFSGKIHYAADHAIVVSKSSFTKKAKELAETTSVFLICVNDLHEIDEILGIYSDLSDEGGDVGFLARLKEIAERVVAFFGVTYLVIMVVVIGYFKSDNYRSPDAKTNNADGALPRADSNLSKQGHRPARMRVIAPIELNIRRGPGTDYEVVEKLKNGDSVDVYEYDPNGWASTPRGWIRSRYLEAID